MFLPFRNFQANGEGWFAQEVTEVHTQLRLSVVWLWHLQRAVSFFEDKRNLEGWGGV